MKSTHVILTATLSLASFFSMHAQIPVTNAAPVAAEAVIPSTYGWDSASALPIGWTAYGIGLYTTGSTAPNSAKFDSQGDSLVIKTSASVEIIRFAIKGNSIKAPYDFSLLESTDGISYTVVKQFSADGNILPSKYTTYSAQADSSSRFFRFCYVTRSGGNVALDDVFLGADAPVQVEQTEQKQAYYLYPNTTDNIIYIQSFMHDIDLEVYDLLGAEVATCNVKANDARELNTSFLRNGIYLLSISSKGKILKTTRFIKR